MAVTSALASFAFIAGCNNGPPDGPPNGQPTGPLKVESAPTDHTKWTKAQKIEAIKKSALPEAQKQGAIDKVNAGP